MSRGQRFLFSGLLIVGLTIFTWLSIGSLVQAQTVNDLGISYASSTGLTAQDPRLVVAKIIRVALGLLGTIGVILVIYAGFLWMTASGNEEKIKRAKDILKAAGIGLIIILMSFAIVSFVLDRLVEATNGLGPGSGGTTTISFVPSGDFMVVGSSPANGASSSPRNVAIRFQFNGEVKADSVTADNAQVLAGADPVAGTWQVNGSEIVFQPETICTGSCGEVHCLPANGIVSVKLTTNIQSAGSEPKNLVCDNAVGGATCELSFSVGSAIDCQDPRAEFISTVGVCAGANNQLKVSATDDSGLARFEFLANGQIIGTPQTGNFGISHVSTEWWNPTGVVGTDFILRSTVKDVTGRQITAQQNGKLLATHCCNNLQDGDETGLDCGGGCLSCEGAACANDMQSPTATCNNSLCASNFCTQQGSSASACQAAGYATGTASCCLCKSKPRIVSLSPLGGFCENNHDQYCLINNDCGQGQTCNQTSPNAKADNLMTIIGSGFGSTTGSVLFADNVAGNLSACGINAWSDNQIVVRVPAGVISGPVKVTNSDNFSATSAQSVLINNITRPGLCALSKSSGMTNELIDYQGLNFNASGSALTKAFYGDLANPIPTNESQALSSTLVKARVPSLQNGQVTTFVRSQSGPASNFLLFNKIVDPNSLPRITRFEPASGASGQYVTIYGQGFGNLKGSSRVLFDAKEADYNFPAECADSFWSDRQIIVKVPKEISAGDKIMSINLASGLTISSSDQFTVNSNPLMPSLCRISPTTGRIGSQVQVWGEYFREYNPAVSGLSFSQNIRAVASRWYAGDSFSSATSTVPSSSVSGPVKVNNSNGSSNGLNFKVGSCQADSDCQGQNQICCPASAPFGGQCSGNGVAGCYGTSDSCVYNWSFTTGSGTITCPSGTTVCGTSCCGDGQGCSNGICADNKLLSCNDYHECDGALYCPNSPGWCSHQTGLTAGGQCGTDYCQKLFKDQTIEGNKAEYQPSLNVCVIKQNCALATTTEFQVGINKVSYQLKCQLNPNQEKSFWTTNLTSGQCPPGNTAYGRWQLMPGNICQSDKTCDACAAKLTCLANKDETYCGLDQKVCANGFACKDNQCQQEANSCECCCDKGLNDPTTKVNPGCCAPLTCTGTCGAGDVQVTVDGSTTTRQFGVCSGCLAVGTTQPEHDAACNCSGSAGKYCLASTPNGLCGDCSQITNAADCASHSTCCFDQKTNKCRGVVDGAKLANGSCGYYACAGGKCSKALSASGDFATQAECDIKCGVVTQQGQSCNLDKDLAGCGYQLCAGPVFGCRTDKGLSVTTTNPNDCGTCCCDPSDDKCNQISNNLHCVANKGDCTGNSRGLCCGCQADSECGSGNGCSNDTCCRTRPKLGKTLPQDGSEKVCRNTAIQATFNQPLAPESLAKNVLLVADYGTDKQCPAGTTYLALGQPIKNSWWFKLRYQLLAWLKPSALAEQPKPSNTYCSIDKVVDVQGNYLMIEPKGALAPQRKYFVVLATDPNLTDGNTQGVLSLNGVSMADGKKLNFNNLELPAALQWSFTTSDQICRIDHVELDPAAVLLSEVGATASFSAVAVNASGQVLTPTPSYDWQWSWSIGNQAVAQMTASGSRAVVTAQNKKDAGTYIRSNAQVTVDQVGGQVTGTTSFFKDAAIKVFLCANPWPARQANGNWQPWTDYATNMQFYYCRDGQTDTQSNDLPGLKVVSSTDPAALNPAFYFFRYSPATTSPTNLKAVSATAGSASQLSWSSYPSATGYKIYHGLRSGQYFSDPLLITNGRTTQATIDELINGQLYYFAISAILQIDQATFVETPLSSETSVRILDTQPPAVVRCLKETAGKNSLNLNWLRNRDDTVAYKVEYRTAGALGTGQTLTVNQPVSGASVSTTIANLINASNIAVEVKAVDRAGNISAKQSPVTTGCN